MDAADATIDGSVYLMWGAWFIALVIAVTHVVWPGWSWWLLSSWQYRDVEAMEPSTRRLRVQRGTAGIWVSALLAVLVAALWPGEPRVKGDAAIIAMLVGYAVVATIAIVGLVRRRRDGRSADEDRNAPPNEPSEIGYVLDYLGLVGSALAFLAIGFMVIGFSTS